MVSIPRQPKKDYLSRIYGAGKLIGRELTKGSDALSPRRRMEKLGFGKTYAHFGRNVWSRPGQRVAQLLGLSKGSYWKRKTIQQEALNLDQKAESAQMRQIVEKEILAKGGELKKDPKIPKMWIDQIEKNLLAGGQFSGGKHVSKEKVGKIIRGISGIPGEVKEYLASSYEGLEQYDEPIERRGTSQGEMAQKFKELQSRGVLKESDVATGERTLGAQEFAPESTKEASPAPGSRWKISALTGWGRKSSGDNK